VSLDTVTTTVFHGMHNLRSSNEDCSAAFRDSPALSRLVDIVAKRKDELLWLHEHVTGNTYKFCLETRSSRLFRILNKFHLVHTRSWGMSSNNTVLSIQSHVVHKYIRNLSRWVMMKTTALGECLEANTALSFASCCISLSTHPLVLYVYYDEFVVWPCMSQNDSIPSSNQRSLQHLEESQTTRQGVFLNAHNLMEVDWCVHVVH